MPQINKTKVKETKNSSTGNFIASEDLKYGDLVIEDPLYSFQVRKLEAGKEDESLAHGQVISHSIDEGDRGDVNIFERWRSLTTGGAGGYVETVNGLAPDIDGNVDVVGSNWTVTGSNGRTYKPTFKSTDLISGFANTLDLSTSNFLTSGSTTYVADNWSVNNAYGRFQTGTLVFGVNWIDPFNNASTYLYPNVDCTAYNMYQRYQNSMCQITQTGGFVQRTHGFVLSNRPSFYSNQGSGSAFSSFSIFADRSQIIANKTGGSAYNSNVSSLYNVSYNPDHNEDVMFTVNSFGECFVKTLKTYIHGITYVPVNYTLPALSTFLDDHLAALDAAIASPIETVSNIDNTWVLPQNPPSKVNLVSASTAPITLTLPQASLSSGFKYTIKKIDASANAVTLDPFSSETIDGSATYTLSSQYDSVTVVCNGTNWFII